LGQLYRAWAAVQQEAGQDPGPSLTRGLALANQLLATRPTWPDARVLRGSLVLLQAQRSARVEDRREQGARAAADFTRALAVNPALDKVWRSQAARAQQLAATPR